MVCSIYPLIVCICQHSEWSPFKITKRPKISICISIINMIEYSRLLKLIESVLSATVAQLVERILGRMRSPVQIWSAAFLCLLFFFLSDSSSSAFKSHLAHYFCRFWRQGISISVRLRFRLLLLWTPGLSAFQCHLRLCIIPG